MKIEKNRHLLLLDGLLQSDGPITAEQLAFLSDSSTRTVKQDIPLLSSQMEKEKIAVIRALKAKGYVIEVLDPEKFALFAEEVAIMQRLYYKYPIETMERRMYIIQSFLSQDLVSLEELEEKLYLSDSSIRKEMEWIRYFLSTYDLEIRHQGGHSYYAEGKEEDIRSAAVEVHCSQYHDFHQSYPHDGFNIMFYRDKNTYEDIRHAFLAILRDSDITISDIAAKKIPTYMCLVKSRLQKGRTIIMNEAERGELKATYDYQIALKISEDPVVKAYYELPENEILQLTKLILANRDIDMRSRGVKGLYKGHLVANGQIYNQVKKEVAGHLGESLFKTEFFRFFESDVLSLQLMLYYKYRFDSTKKDILVTYSEGNESLISPIPMEMARIMIMALEKVSGQKIRDPVISAYAQLFEKMLKKVTYPYRKLRLVACSTEGLVYTQNMIENILSRYQRYIASAEAYDLYEMRKLDFSKYDALIHSGWLMYYRYPLKAVSVKEIDYQYSSSKIFDSLFKDGYDRSRIEELKKMLHVFPETDLGDIDSFVEKMSFRYGVDYKSEIRLYEEYKEKKEILDPYLTRLHSFLTFFDYQYCRREFVDIYVGKEPGIYNETMKTDFVIIACLNPNNPISSLKIDNHIIQIFLQVDGTINKVLEDKDKALDEMFDRIVEINFVGY